MKPIMGSEILADIYNRLTALETARMKAKTDIELLIILKAALDWYESKWIEEKNRAFVNRQIAIMPAWVHKAKQAMSEREAT